MSLRLRLSLSLGLAFILLWGAAATWMLIDARQQILLALDQRLAASARMVAGLLGQMPQIPIGKNGISHISAEHLGIKNGLACQVSSVHGEILARSHAAPERTLEAKRTGYHLQLINGRRWRTYTLEHNGLRITTADPIDEREGLLKALFQAAGIPVLLALIGSLLVLWLGLGKGLRPLKLISQALVKRSAESCEPIDVGALPKELAPLVHSQNQLFARISHLIEHERRLTDDAAHELRSPLTALKTHLQVAGMTQGKVAQQALHQAELSADHMQQILEQLLMLARVEGHLSFDDGQRASPIEIAHLAIADSMPGALIELHCQITEPCQITLPTTLAVAALRNVLDNARRHTQPGTSVRLMIEQTQKHIWFHVQDQGPGISPEQLVRFSQRFWRGSQSSGSGLGLSIVRAIAERFDGEIRLQPNAQGLEVSFSLAIPA